MNGRWVCDWCGADVGRYATLFGEGWMHRQDIEASSCAKERGKTEWQPVEQLGLRLVP